ncbi:MAG: response regulator [Dehalococcoidia bacterium]|nr:response regulator [Dehalococcoidia bacterium]
MTEKQHRILIVDDEKVIRRVLRAKLSDRGYQCLEAGNAEEAMDEMRASLPDVVMLDIMMPGKLGSELLPEIKAGYPDTAVIMITAVIDAPIAIECMRQGAYDYLTKPFSLDEVVLSVDRALEDRRLKLELKNYQQHLEKMVEERTRELRQAVEKLKVASLETILRLARAAEYRDENTGAHIKRMSQYCAAIARKTGLNTETVEIILYAAPMHDVGKIAVPDRILLKPGPLNPDEWEVMKQHAVIGAQILEGSDAEFIKMASVIALTHHEKWDGSGYPRGLKGSKIPLAGRIAAIADVFDAMTSKRPYKEPFSLEKALGIIKQCAGSHFDPKVVAAFFAAEDEILSIKETYKDEQESLLVQMVG